MEDKKQKKINIGPVIVAAVIAAVFLASGIYYYHHTIIHDGKAVDIRSTDWAYEIESAELSEDSLVIRGWCFKETEDTKKAMPELRIILQDTRDESGKIYIKAAYGMERPDVAAYFAGNPEQNGEYPVRDYTFCGFEASVSREKINPEHTYEIILQQNDRDSAVVKTGVYLRQGELCPADPDWFAPPDTEGTDLAEIVENGCLRAYVPESGVYIYQKDWKLYLLINENSIQGMQEYAYAYYDYFAFSVRNSMAEYDYLIYNGSSYLNWDDITDTLIAGHYHVIMREIPDTFPVAWIEIGLYTEEGLINYLRFFPLYGFHEQEEL